MFITKEEDGREGKYETWMAEGVIHIAESQEKQEEITKSGFAFPIEGSHAQRGPFPHPPTSCLECGTVLQVQSHLLSMEQEHEHPSPQTQSGGEGRRKGPRWHYGACSGLNCMPQNS